MKTNLLSLRMALATCIAMVAIPSVHAGTEHWTGASTSSINWTDANNWAGLSPAQTYYNQVDFYDFGGTTNLNDFSVNTILDGTTGVAQMPIWNLRFYPTNRNFTVQIAPGQSLRIGAGNGAVNVGGDEAGSGRGLPGARETITILGPGATFSMSGSLVVGQGLSSASYAPSSQYVTLDMSGLDTFVMNPTINNGGNASSRFLLCGQNTSFAQGAIYLAKTNNILLGNDMEIGAMSVYSNTMPTPVYLGMVNSIQVGNNGAANGNVTIGSRDNTNAFMVFNPAFLGGPAAPTVSFGSPNNGGRVNNFYICYNTGGGPVPGYAYGDFTGGNVTLNASTMTIGYGGAAGASALGVLTADNGVMNVNTLNIGYQSASGGGAGVGILNLGSSSTYATNASMTVNGTLALATVATGTLTTGTAGTVNIKGGALSAGTIINGLGVGTINVNNGSLTVAGTAGASSAPVTSLSLTNSTLNLGLTTLSPTMTVNNLTTAGANTINILSSPALTSLPAVFTLVKYSGTMGGAGYNFTLGTLPALCAGYISNDVANSSVDLVLTSGPKALTWNGNVNGNWDTTTANWMFGGPVDYADGEFVIFPDGAATGNVSLQSTFAPDGVTVTNNSLTYVFTGANLTGSGKLVKQGAGTLIVDNSGNTYTGGVTVSGGTLQVGNNDNSGDLPGSIVNNGTLVYNRTDSITVTNPISGSGVLVAEGGAQVTLSGSSTFTNGVLVTNNTTLQLGNAAATGNAGTGSGNLVIANGSTLDANGNSVAKKIIVSGTGSGNGAIVDNGGPIYDNPGTGLATNITLAGDTTFYYPVRWDLGSPTSGQTSLNTGGHAYNLTLNSPADYFEWRNLTLDAKLGNITLQQGTLGVVGSTTMGDPAAMLTISAGATLKLYNASSTLNAYVNKTVDLQNNASINNGGGNNVMNGPMTLEPGGACGFNIGGGTTLTLSNVLSGSGTLYMNGGTGNLVLAGNSPDFTGGAMLYNGTLTLNGSIGSGIYAAGSSTTVAGSGTASGLVDISGTLLPGGNGTAGTLTVGGLTLEGGSTLTMDLNANNTVGSGSNDLIVVNGDLNANGNTLYINPIGSSLASSYTLLTYTGNLASPFAGVSTVGASRYVLSLNYVTTTTPAQVQLIVSGSGGGPAALVWNNASGDALWDTQASQNWSNQVAHVSPDYFFTQDSVLFDNSITGAANPATTVTIPGTVIPSVMTNNSTANYTFIGAGKISGAASIVKQGSGTLTLGTTNDFTGSVTVQGGMLVQGTNSALGAPTGNVYITNSGTVDLNGYYNLAGKTLYVGSTGVGGNGAIVNNKLSAAVYDNPGSFTNIILTTDATFGGGASRWDLGSATGGTLSTGGKAYSLNLVGNPVGGPNATYWEWDNMTIDPQFANLNILSGELGVKAMTSLGNPAGTVTIYGGGQLTFWGGNGYSKNYYVKSNGTMLVRLDGGTYNLNVTLEGGATFTSYNNAKTNTGTVNLLGLAHFVVQNAACILSNTISGTGGFYMDNSDSNPLVLAANNTYTGSTLLTNSGSGAVLALVGNGSISSSSLIGLNSGTVIDVSGRLDKTLTLAGNQTLTGNGTVRGSLVANAGSTVTPGNNGNGTLTVTNAVTLQGTTAMSIGTGFNNLLNATNIIYGGTLSLSFTPGSLTAGQSFKLFNAGSYSGSFASITPSTPGSGLAWDTTQLTVNGTLRVVAQSAPPTIGHVTINGTSLSISGAGGQANGTYHIRTSTSLTAPLSTWTVLGSGSFDNTGNFNYIGTVNPSEPQRYYILVEP